MPLVVFRCHNARLMQIVFRHIAGRIAALVGCALPAALALSACGEPLRILQQAASLRRHERRARSRVWFELMASVVVVLSLPLMWLARRGVEPRGAIATVQPAAQCH